MNEKHFRFFSPHLFRWPSWVIHNFRNYRYHSAEMLPTVRAKLGQTSSFPNGPQIWFPIMNLGAQLRPMSITCKLSFNLACQMGPIHCTNFFLSGLLDRILVSSVDYRCVGPTLKPKNL